MEIKFRDLKEAFGVVGQSNGLKCLRAMPKFDFQKPKMLRMHVDIENVKNELVDVSMLPEVDERKHFERYFASKKNKPSRHGGRRGRGRHGKGRRR